MDQHQPVTGVSTGSTAGEPTPPQPQYGQYAPGIPSYGAPQYGQHGAAPQGGWNYQPPVDKPGIIPLKPLGLGELLDGAFSAVRHNPKVMIVLPTAVILVATLLGVAIGLLLTGPFTSLFGDPAMDQALTTMGLTASTMGGIYGTSLGTALTLGLASPVVYGLLTVSVSRSVLGDKPSTSEVWQRLRPRVGKLIGWTLLQVGVSAVAILLLIGIIVGAAVANPVAGAVVGILGGLGFIVLAVWVSIKVVLVSPALALEQGTLFATISRAWALTKGSFWRLLGVYLLASIIVGVAASIVAVPLTMVSTTLALAGGSGLAMGATLVTSTLAGVISGVLQSVFVGAVVALLYIDQRMRREALDVSLATAARNATT